MMNIMQIDMSSSDSFHRYTSLWKFFSVKSLGACPPPQEFFDMWVKFSSDFLLFWKREQQLIAKQIYEETKKKVYKEKVEGLAVKPATVTGLKLKLASSKKTNWVDFWIIMNNIWKQISCNTIKIFESVVQVNITLASFTPEKGTVILSIAVYCLGWQVPTPPLFAMCTGAIELKAVSQSVCAKVIQYRVFGHVLVFYFIQLCFLSIPG